MWSRPKPIRGLNRGGFTLIEILTAIFILAIVVSLVMGSFDGVFSNADHINNSTDLFEMGSSALHRITSDLAAVHALAYPRYRPPDIDDDPELYRLVGEQRLVGAETFSWLRFTSLAHLPLNQAGREGIAEIVYYVQATENDSYILKRADHLYPYPEEFEENPGDPILCEQLREFKLVYFGPEELEQEEWNSEDEDVDYTTPRAVGIRLAVGEGTSPFVFETQIILPVYRQKPGQGQP